MPRRELEEVVIEHHNTYFKELYIGVDDGDMVIFGERKNDWDSFDEVHKQAALNAMQHLVDNGFIEVK